MRIVTKGGGAYNQNGDWVESKPTYSDYIPCRYEPNGAAQTIALPDGTAYRYSFTVYMCVNPDNLLRYGDVIELTSQDGIVRGEFTVRGFHRGQLDMKVWV